MKKIVEHKEQDDSSKISRIDRDKIIHMIEDYKIEIRRLNRRISVLHRCYLDWTNFEM